MSASGGRIWVLCFFAFCVCNIVVAEWEVQEAAQEAVPLLAGSTNATLLQAAGGYPGPGALRSSATRKLTQSYLCDFTPTVGTYYCGVYPYGLEPYPGCCVGSVCTGYNIVGSCTIFCTNPAARLACCNGYSDNFLCNASPSTPTNNPPATLPPTTLPPATLPPTTLPPATLPPATLPPATLPPATLPPATLSPTTRAPAPASPASLAPVTNRTVVASAPTSIVAPAPSLDPKATDKVITSAFAVGVVRYYCADPVNATFDIIGITATLYSNRGLVVGNLTSVSNSQVFNLTSGSAVVGPRDTGNAYPVPVNNQTDGGYGSLPVQYTSASGTIGATKVTAITFTATNGGVLPAAAPCTALPFLTEILPPWYVPFQANVTFFSVYTPPQ